MAVEQNHKKKCNKSSKHINMKINIKGKKITVQEMAELGP